MAYEAHVDPVVEQLSDGVLTEPSILSHFAKTENILDRIQPNATLWNPDALEWDWEVILIKDKQLNAFCMPGGKIAFFSGIVEELELTDDEIAMIMGHEMAHALREHARARIALAQLTDLGAEILSATLGLGRSEQRIIGFGRRRTLL